MNPYVYSNTIYNIQELETAQVSIIKWVDKKAVVHLHEDGQIRDWGMDFFLST